MIGQGQLCAGATGNGGDIGHVVVDPDGPACACGGHGCLGTFLTPGAMRRSAQDADRAATHLADTVSSVVRLLDPEMVVLGGPATESLGGFFRAAVERRLASLRPGGLPAIAVGLSGLGADAGPVGAASMVLHDVLAPRIDRLLLVPRS